MLGHGATSAQDATAKLQNWTLHKDTKFHWKLLPQENWRHAESITKSPLILNRCLELRKTVRIRARAVFGSNSWFFFTNWSWPINSVTKEFLFENGHWMMTRHNLSDDYKHSDELSQCFHMHHDHGFNSKFCVQISCVLNVNQGAVNLMWPLLHPQRQPHCSSTLLPQQPSFIQTNSDLFHQLTKLLHQLTMLFSHLSINIKKIGKRNYRLHTTSPSSSDNMLLIIAEISNSLMFILHSFS